MGLPPELESLVAIEEQEMGPHQEETELVDLGVGSGKLGFVWKGVSEFSFGFLNLLEINPDRNTMRKMRLPWIKQLLVCVLLEVLG